MVLFIIERLTSVNVLLNLLLNLALIALLYWLRLQRWAAHITVRIHRPLQRISLPPKT